MSFLFGRTTEEKEKEEYERLLKDRIERDIIIKKVAEAKREKTSNKEKQKDRLQYLEDKFNPNQDKRSIIQPDYREQMKKKIEEEFQKKFEENVKKYPNISFEEVVLRTYGGTSRFYKDEYYVNLYNRLTKQSSKPKSPPKQSSPPKPPPLPSPPKRSSLKKSSPKSKLTKETLEQSKSKLKPKGPPNPPIPPSPPKKNSPKPNSKITKETLEQAKTKLKHSQINLKPDNPDYDLEMAFRELEK
jgi:hypothetical protein